jgi:ABC-type tungstate transport system substrate-binding protein
MGELALAVALGIVLLTVALMINILTQIVRGRLQDNGYEF